MPTISQLRPRGYSAVIPLRVPLAILEAIDAEAIDRGVSRTAIILERWKPCAFAKNRRVLERRTAAMPLIPEGQGAPEPELLEDAEESTMIREAQPQQLTERRCQCGGLLVASHPGRRCEACGTRWILAE
ncbi:MAG: hypothetical protein ACLGXA_14960 [Acidobacteriota bacterium]